MQSLFHGNILVTKERGDKMYRGYWLYRIWTGGRGEVPTAKINDKMCKLIIKELKKRGTVVQDEDLNKSYMVVDDLHELTYFYEKEGEKEGEKYEVRNRNN